MNKKHFKTENLEANIQKLEISGKAGSTARAICKNESGLLKVLVQESTYSEPYLNRKISSFLKNEFGDVGEVSITHVDLNRGSRLYLKKDTNNYQENEEVMLYPTIYTHWYYGVVNCTPKAIDEELKTIFIGSQEVSCDGGDGRLEVNIFEISAS